MAEPADVVESYLYAVMRDKDFDVVRSLLADDVVYENVGYPTMRGADRIVSMFRRLNSPKLRFDVTIHRIAQDGFTVLTERTDSMIIGVFEAKFWVCGVFEVHDGQITLWRDYFDFYDLVKGVVRGLAALAIPALRQK
ncbi:limonene-1,2-epoxide hydrolase family protein [Mycobacterium sp. NPDC051198]